MKQGVGEEEKIGVWLTLETWLSVVRFLTFLSKVTT